MKIEFDIDRTTLGRIPTGAIFVYENKVWKVVNKIDGESKALVTHIGNGCRPSFLLASSTKVCYIIETLDIQEGTNGSD
tara:strand:+ start:224 stop:460 length:237 start_codon:yes stop_codon:yes gene_type:complete